MRVSVFDMMKIGVGPSSSHTMGPWRAATFFLREDVQAAAPLEAVQRVVVELFGSLAKTGRGHGTDIAVIYGLRGQDPATCETAGIGQAIETTRARGQLDLLGAHSIAFNPDTDIVFHFDRTLSYHPNGLRFNAYLEDGSLIRAEYYSVGGGFVVKAGETDAQEEVTLPYPCDSAQDIQRHCDRYGLSIAQMVMENERAWRSDDQITGGLLRIWHTMADCIYRGCHTEGTLPGGLNVTRRASMMHHKLIGERFYTNRREWVDELTARKASFQEVIKWISCFALAVNEENAAFGRVVTAPTNGAAGVVPAVLLYYVAAYRATEEDIVRFLLIAGEIGSLFKKGATISAAMGGCQAEIGVSSAMAAAALTECLGGSVQQALMAAEIAMEHHLGLTCDPVAGLVQIPCIERNAMGAIKAITAANIALESQPQHAKVSLDAVIKTMWQTALDMSEKYKETAEGGLALQISVNVPEC